jgi:hypothetical protein
MTTTIKVTSLDKIVLNDNQWFIALSTGLSCFSLLKGQLSYISASKGNFLPLKGAAVLAVYISLSLAVRVFTVLLCYTPILGLYDATHHGPLGILKTDLSSFEPPGKFIYDVSQNDTIVTFSHAWDNHCLEHS